MKKLAAGCGKYRGRYLEHGVIFGPMSNRVATDAERRGLVLALQARRHLVIDNRGTVRDCFGGGSVSKLDARYAVVTYGCRDSGGQDIVERTSTGWKDVGPSQNRACASFPPGVVRSLVGYCVTSFR
jgi:hypothetical protein